jgi:DNA-3-methyladenine glycosylase II
MYTQLNESLLQDATLWLCTHDPALARVHEQFGFPPLWARAPDFATLVHIVLEQQVSLSSANAAFKRLKALLPDFTPHTFLFLSDEQLRSIGFSRQKTLYTRNLAEHLLDGRLDLQTLHALPDDEVRHTLTQLKGIGPWTADIYLSECLLRPDVLPKGDIAMLEAFKDLYHLPNRPDHDTFVRSTAHWRPWRSVGTRLLWHYYLNR